MSAICHITWNGQYNWNICIDYNSKLYDNFESFLVDLENLTCKDLICNAKLINFSMNNKIYNSIIECYGEYFKRYDCLLIDLQHFLTGFSSNVNNCAMINIKYNFIMKYYVDPFELSSLNKAKLDPSINDSITNFKNSKNVINLELINIDTLNQINKNISEIFSFYKFDSTNLTNRKIQLGNLIKLYDDCYECIDYEIINSSIQCENEFMSSPITFTFELMLHSQ